MLILAHTLQADDSHSPAKPTKEDNAFTAISSLKSKFDAHPYDHCSDLNNLCLQYLLRYTDDHRTPEVAMIFIETEQCVGAPPFSNNLPVFDQKIADIVLHHPNATEKQKKKAKEFVRMAVQREANKNKS